MGPFKITVKPQPGGKVDIHLQGFDDTGHYIDSYFSAENQNSVKSAVNQAIRSMQVVASEVTEDETFLNDRVRKVTR